VGSAARRNVPRRLLRGFLSIERRFDLAVRNGKYPAREVVESSGSANDFLGRDGLATAQGVPSETRLIPVLRLSQIQDRIIIVNSHSPKALDEIGPSCATLSTATNKVDIVPEKKMYNFVGKMVPGQTIGFEPSSEPFSLYTLADGTSVKVKMVMLDAVRLDAFNETGDPVYQFQFQQVVGVVAPDSLKKKPH
jgi:hypothetical protein